MTHPVKAFQDAAATTRMERATQKAQTAIDNGQEKTAHIAKLLEELTQLPAAPHGVSFKGGLAGDTASLSYSDTYNRKNGKTSILQLKISDAGYDFTVKEADGSANNTQVKTQLDALSVIGGFLGRVAPERETEVVMALARAATATRAQTQIQNEGAGRWAARPL